MKILAFAACLYAALAVLSTSIRPACAFTDATARSLACAPAQVDGKPLTGPRGTVGNGLHTTRAGWWTRLMINVRLKQQAFYRNLTGALKAFRHIHSAGAAAGWGLVTISFLYGIFHAIGPGHGKAVISAWLAANEHQLRHGILLAFASAIFQAVTAIMCVSVPLMFAHAIFNSVRKATYYMELISYGLICAIGLVMLWKTLRHWIRLAPSSHCKCGHCHMPVPEDFNESRSFRQRLSIIFTVGIRPCSGAILVLLYSNTLGLYAVGIGATLAMALGTAVTVCSVALAAVTSRKLIICLTGGSSLWLKRCYAIITVCAGTGLLVFGATLFVATFDAPRPIL